jgi:hypothetical protein
MVIGPCSVTLGKFFPNCFFKLVTQINLNSRVPRKITIQKVYFLIFLSANRAITNDLQIGLKNIINYA